MPTKINVFLKENYKKIIYIIVSIISIPIIMKIVSCLFVFGNIFGDLLRRAGC